MSLSELSLDEWDPLFRWEEYILQIKHLDEKRVDLYHESMKIFNWIQYDDNRNKHPSIVLHDFVPYSLLKTVFPLNLQQYNTLHTIIYIYNTICEKPCGTIGNDDEETISKKYLLNYTRHMLFEYEMTMQSNSGSNLYQNVIKKHHLKGVYQQRMMSYNIKTVSARQKPTNSVGLYKFLLCRSNFRYTPILAKTICFFVYPSYLSISQRVL